MTPDEAATAVFAVIGAVAPEVPAETLVDQASFRDDLDLDSVDFLNVLIGVYERTGIEVPERDYDTVTRVGDLVSYLAARG